MDNARILRSGQCLNMVVPTVADTCNHRPCALNALAYCRHSVLSALALSCNCNAQPTTSNSCPGFWLSFSLMIIATAVPLQRLTVFCVAAAVTHWVKRAGMSKYT
jgi:hypothetical protein